MFLPTGATAKTSSWIHLGFQIQPSRGSCWGVPLPPPFSSVPGLSKIHINCEKVHIKTLFLRVLKRDWPWSVAQDVDQGPESGQGESVATQRWTGWWGCLMAGTVPALGDAVFFDWVTLLWS